MELSCFECVGYYGHKKEVIKETIENRKFYVSNSEWDWLGTGIYFFESHKQQAVDWCIKVRKYSEWSIIEGTIKAKLMLDLINPVNFVELEKYISKIRQRYNQISGCRKLTTKLIFDLLYSLEPYDAVRHAFPVGKKTVLINPTQIIKMQIQLCVRNSDCINNFKEVD